MVFRGRMRHFSNNIYLAQKNANYIYFYQICLIFAYPFCMHIGKADVQGASVKEFK